MTEVEGLTPAAKWGQGGPDGHAGGAERQIGGLFKEPLNSNMAAVFKEEAAEGRGRVLGRGCGAPPLIFQLIYCKNRGPV